ncbi:MAG: hypothetical protein CUN54_02755 [Phototrophicales bacterium]|nr:MAG: hypothetical protein CUN54_02755 [Phototrophicales bacterium]
MNLFRQLSSWLGMDNTTISPPPTDRLRDLLDLARRAKRAEDYTTAIQHLDEALDIALERRDATARAVIILQKTELLILQRQWEQAEMLLNEVRRDARASGDKTQLAYTLNAMGLLWQARGEWSRARQYYEEAFKVAEEADSIGAQGRAQGNLGATYLHENNASYAVRLLTDAVMQLNMTDDIEMSSYFVGLLGQSKIENGDEQEGQQYLIRALRLAERMGYRMYERRWSVALGNLAFERGENRAAHNYYQRAIGLFAPDMISNEHITVLCRASRVSLNVGLVDDALQFADKAWQLFQSNRPADIADVIQLGQPEDVANAMLENPPAKESSNSTTKASSATKLDPTLEALVEGTLGIALQANGRSAEALPHLEAAVRIENKTHDAHHIDITREIAAAYAGAGNHERALEMFQQAIERAAASGLALEQAHALRDMGEFYAKIGATQDAIRAWTDALSIYKVEKVNTQIARVYCDMANTRKFAGQGQRAMKDYEQALMALNALDDDDLPTRGVVLSNAAVAYVDQGDVESARAFFREAIIIAERLGDRAAEATRRGNYGWFLLAIGHTQEAITTLKHALEISRSINLTLSMAVQTDNLGLAHDRLGNHEEALHYHQEALRLLEGIEHPHWKAIFQANQGQTLLALNRPDEARPLFESALASGRGKQDIEVTIQALCGLAHLAMKRDAPQDADALLVEAIDLARKADMRRLLAEALTLRSEQQAALHHTDEAQATWEEAQNLFRILHAPQADLKPQWLNHAADRLS